MSENLEAHRNVLQDLVSSLGRDDIGVGNVEVSGDTLRFTLSRGDHTHRAEMPLGFLSSRSQASSALMAIIPNLSKAIEQEHIDAAQRST